MLSCNEVTISVYVSSLPVEGVVHTLFLDISCMLAEGVAHCFSK